MKGLLLGDECIVFHGKFNKKKAREAELIELKKGEYVRIRAGALTESSQSVWALRSFDPGFISA